MTKEDETTQQYDSTADTLLHIRRVVRAINTFTTIMLARANHHDTSKLSGEEKVDFDSASQKLRKLTYGSDEYKASLDEIRPAIQMHYAANTHHPEHYPEGIKGFDLFDLVEMYCDWIAAVERHDDGDIMRSITHNQERFSTGEVLAEIMRNTADRVKL